MEAGDRMRIAALWHSYPAKARVVSEVDDGCRNGDQGFLDVRSKLRAAGHLSSLEARESGSGSEPNSTATIVA